MGKEWNKQRGNEVVRMRDSGMKFTEIAKHYHGATEHNVKYLYNRTKDMAKDENGGFTETEEILADGKLVSEKIIELYHKDKNDPEKILEAHGFDSELFDIVTVRKSVWQQRSNKTGLSHLYASRIVVKVKSGDLADKTMKKIVNSLEKIKIKSPKRSRQDNNSKLMYEVNVADLHLGKLCLYEETEDHFDLKVAEERFKYVIQDFVDRAPDKVEKVLFIFSNDYFHFDTLLKTTTSGTPQDTNTHLQSLFQLGCSLLVWAVDTLNQLGDVDIKYVGANHDKMMSFFACEWLDAYYRQNDSVIVDTIPRSRKYVEFGNSLIQFSHGHSEKKRLGSTMQSERREAWGRTLFHEVHAGHIHSEKMTEEDNGLIIRHVSSITGTDRWHYDSGYVGAVLKSQAFLWDKEKGLINIINSVIMKGDNLGNNKDA